MRETASVNTTFHQMVEGLDFGTFGIEELEGLEAPGLTYRAGVIVGVIGSIALVGVGILLT